VLPPTRTTALLTIKPLCHSDAAKRDKRNLLHRAAERVQPNSKHKLPAATSSSKAPSSHRSTKVLCSLLTDRPRLLLPLEIGLWFVD
jgi:hypothetical protein